MNKFNKLVEQIFQQYQSLPNSFNINEISNIYTPKYKWFNTYEILNEYIEDEELTPVPQQFFNHICNNIDIKNFQILKYSYQQILNLLEKYNYEYYEDFKNELQKHYNDGYLYIISCSELNERYLQNNQNELMNIYNKLSETFNEESIEDIILNAGKSNNGITSTLKNYDISIYKNIYILINQNKIFLKSWTKTIEHELTHFVQRIVGYEKTLKRCTIKPSAGITFYIQYKNFFNTIFNNNITNNLLTFINYILKDKEQDTSIKHVLGYFQLMYEYEIPIQQDNLKDRLIWLHNKLTKLENINYYQSNEWKNNLNLIKQNYDDLSYEDQIKFNFIHAELGYLICNKILTNKKVKEKLINYFNKFNYGEF